MKKKIALVVILAAALVGAGFVGIALAAGPPSVSPTGMKLVSGGLVGYLTHPNQSIQLETRINYRNPSSVYDITLEKVCIYGADGTLVYDGPFMDWFDEQNNNAMIDPPTPLYTIGPHETQLVRLSLWTGIPDQGTAYTVEVFWSGNPKGLPLMADGWQHWTHYYDDGNIAEEGIALSVVNLART
jgi:hypothetical protein